MAAVGMSILRSHSPNDAKSSRSRVISVSGSPEYASKPAETSNNPGFASRSFSNARSIPRRVMPRRPHEAKGALPADAGKRGLDRCAGGRDRMVIDPWISRRIRIKILHCSSYLLHVIARMGAQQITFLRRLRLAPFPVSMSIFQHWDGARDSLRPLRMARA